MIIREQQSEDVRTLSTIYSWEIKQPHITVVAALENGFTDSQVISIHRKNAEAIIEGLSKMLSKQDKAVVWLRRQEAKKKRTKSRYQKSPLHKAREG